MPTRSEKYILAVDLSTSGAKTALVSLSGRIVAMEFEPDDIILLPNGGAEQDPALWWNRIKSTCKKLIARKLVSVDDIMAISCTAQWSGTVAVDKNGDNLANAIIWMDFRGKPYIQKITNGWINIKGYGLTKLFKWLRLTGGAPTHSGKGPLSHILYIKNALPDVYKNTYKFLEPKDFINLKFTGKFAASCDSIGLHWITDNRNISRIVYDDRLIEMSTIDGDKFPELKRSVDILGTIKPELAKELGLNQNTKVVTGSSDVQSAAIGSGAVRDYQSQIYIGTSSWMTCHVPFKKTSLSHNIASLPSSIPERYLVTNEQESAGACLNYLKNNIFCHNGQLEHSEDPDALDIFNKIAHDSPPGSNKLIFTPWLYGERTPAENHSVRSCFFNQSLRTTRADMIRAVFEGVAYNSRWLHECMEKFVKRPIDNINMIGGGANSDLWCRIYADVLNRTINQVAEPIGANLRGAAFIGAVAAGCMSFDDIPDRIEIAATYKPDPANRKIYDKLYSAFKNIYKKNKSIYADLNRIG